MRTNRTQREHGGLRVVGREFTVWDADPREALRLARELGKGEAQRLPAPTSAYSQGPRRPPAASR
jgi:hypothetical protein